MKSIQQKLRAYLSISISALLVLILLITDISVDRWISDEFERAMLNKVGLLETLLEEDEEGLEFDFAGEFMPEFEGKDNPEYYQFWHNNRVFEKSDTLELFEVKELPRLDVKLNEYRIQDITLPDGREGKMLFTKFLPQIDSEDRERLGVTKEEFEKNQMPVEFAYALSKEELEYILWFVDITFLITTIFSIVTIRWIVNIIVKRELTPITKFSTELKQVSLLSSNLEVSAEGLPIELIPIADSVNYFILENHRLYKRESRITSDIAHELKTPITELISLSEVAQKFPHEKEITDNLAKEVFDISKRLKTIVNSILLLQKSSNDIKLEMSDVNLKDMLEVIVKRENSNNRDINIKNDMACVIIRSNEFALETILSNLVNNALYYSPLDTQINISVNKNNENHTLISISNICADKIDEEAIKYLFEPLWQNDSSRTSNERYGLGLSIVASYCKRLDASIDVSLSTENIITFKLKLK